ncbi:MAG: DinB family protein [Gemmatimonadaceae bacterium]
MQQQGNWREIVASSLGWEQGHATLENAVKDLPANLRGKIPPNYPHSIWQLLEHIRITQHDLLEFCQNPEYVEKLEWPQDYWPPTIIPSDGGAWNKTLADCRSDRESLAKFVNETKLDLTAKIPRGTVQTYLRTVLLAVDHASYHVGQIVSVRRLLGAWPAK